MLVMYLCCKLAVSVPVKPDFHYLSSRPEFTGDRFLLTVDMGRVDGPAFPLAELTDLSTRLVETRLSTWPVLTVNGNRSPVNSGRQLG